jgi:hypothetical protein
MEFDHLSLETLRKDGVLLAPSALTQEWVTKLKQELSGWDKVTFNHQIGSTVIGGNLWIENLGICSATALKGALDPNLIELLDGFFEEKTILGSLKYQKKITGQGAIPLHSDRGPGVVMFIFLNMISEETGATRFVKGTHLAEGDDNVITGPKSDADYINTDDQKKTSGYITSYGGPGTILLYSQKTWHDLPKFTKPGREIIWAMYYPISKATYGEDHLIRSSIFRTLTAQQQNRLLHGKETAGVSFFKLGNSWSHVDSYAIKPWKIILYVLRHKVYQVIEKLTSPKA